MVNDNLPRVLVVDNVADAADSLVFLLGLWGYGAAACYDGSAALEIARFYQPQAVVLDLGMPCLDGFEVARRMREQPWSQQAVFLAVTGHESKAHRVRAQEVGFDHYLLKPAQPEEIHDLLLRLVGQPELPRVLAADTQRLQGAGSNRPTNLLGDGPTAAETATEITCSLVRIPV